MGLNKLISHKNDSINYNVTLQEILDAMTKENVKHFVLVKNKQAVGIITERDILRIYAKHENLNLKAIDFANKNIVTTQINRQSDYVLGLMINHKIRRIIVTDENKNYVGSILQEKIIFEFEQDIFKTNIIAYDIIKNKNKASNVNYDATVQDALNLMNKKDLGSILVYKNDKPIGILTESDIINLAQKHIDTKENIINFATKELIIFKSSESLFDIVNSMKLKNIRRAIVFNEINNNYYIITSKEIINNVKGNYNLFLESKLKDAKNAFNSLNEAVIELFDNDVNQTVYWLNNKARDLFNLNIDDSITNLISKPRWNLIYKQIQDNSFNKNELIEIDDNIFQLTIIKGKILENTIIKLLFSNVSEIANTGKKIESQFKLLYEEVPTPYQSLDENGIIQNVNKKWLEITGYQKNEVIGQKFKDFTKNPNETQKYSNKLLKKKHLENSLLELIKKDGTTILASYTGNVSNINSDIRTHCVFKDITREQQLQKKLLLSDIVFENTDEGIFVTNEKNEIIRVNDSFTRITGYDFHEVEGKTPSILKSASHEAKFYEQLWKDLLSKGSWEGEILNKNKYGMTYPQWLNINIVTDEDGNILNYVALFSDITKIKESAARMEFLAHHDPLTKLPNRHYLSNKLESLTNSYLNSDDKFAILFIDIDKFKNINDNYGHAMGDRVIEVVANRLQKNIRSNDTISRIGGDEFVVVLEKMKEIGDIEKIASKIVNDFQEPIKIKDKKLAVTLSIGVSVFPDDSTDMDEIIKNADIAMYNSKQNGRNQYLFFNNSLLDEFSQNIKIKDSLLNAIHKEEFDVHYQPIVSMKSNKIIGAEALIRWNNKENGLIPPNEFIKDAENLKLINPIEEIVIKRACKFMKKLNDLKILEDGMVSINVSNTQMKNKNILKLIKNELKNSQIQPHNIEIEISENYILDDKEDSINVVQKLKQLGVKISIHNFGTGYLSLNHLKQLPIDKLKIDKSFVQTLPNDKRNIGIIKSLLSLDETFDLETFVEGIEQKEQKEFLEKLGCHGAQGWFYAKPLSEEEFIELVTNSK